MRKWKVSSDLLFVCMCLFESDDEYYNRLKKTKHAKQNMTGMLAPFI